MISEILGAPTEETKSLRGKKDSVNFLNICGILDDMNIKNMKKKALKSEYQ